MDDVPAAGGSQQLEVHHQPDDGPSSPGALMAAGAASFVFCPSPSFYSPRTPSPPRPPRPLAELVSPPRTPIIGAIRSRESSGDVHVDSFVLAPRSPLPSSAGDRSFISSFLTISATQSSLLPAADIEQHAPQVDREEMAYEAWMRAERLEHSRHLSAPHSPLAHRSQSTESYADGARLSGLESVDTAFPTTPPSLSRRPSSVSILTAEELRLVAALHQGRVPHAHQLAPPLDDFTRGTLRPVVNTGNSGPMIAQDGDWRCGECSFVNWRRRKVCKRCFPLASEIGLVIPASASAISPSASPSTSFTSTMGSSPMMAASSSYSSVDTSNSSYSAFDSKLSSSARFASTLSASDEVAAAVAAQYFSSSFSPSNAPQSIAQGSARRSASYSDGQVSAVSPASLFSPHTSTPVRHPSNFSSQAGFAAASFQSHAYASLTPHTPLRDSFGRSASLGAPVSPPSPLQGLSREHLHQQEALLQSIYGSASLHPPQYVPPTPHSTPVASRRASTVSSPPAHRPSWQTLAPYAEDLDAVPEDPLHDALSRLAIARIHD